MHHIAINITCTKCKKSEQFAGDNMTECAQSIALAGWTGDECPKCTDQQDWRKQARDTYNELYRKGYPDGNPMLMVLTFVYEQSLSVCDLGCGGATLATFFDKYTGLDVSDAVSYTHLTLPTNREV